MQLTVANTIDCLMQQTHAPWWLFDIKHVTFVLPMHNNKNAEIVTYKSRIYIFFKIKILTTFSFENMFIIE